MGGRKMGDQDNFCCLQNKVKIRNVAHNEKKTIFVNQKFMIILELNHLSYQYFATSSAY